LLLKARIAKGKELPVTHKKELGRFQPFALILDEDSVESEASHKLRINAERIGFPVKVL
jgi:hypothetical protein